MKKNECSKMFVVFCITLLLFFAVSTTSFAGGAKEEPVPVKEGVMDQMELVQQEGNKLNIYDWAEWWPEEIYEGFSKEYGIKIVRDNFASVDEMITKFKLNPNIDYDLTLPDTRGFIQMKELGVLQELNHEWLPNVEKYLPEETKKAWFDSGYRYSVATDLYFVGYSYNTKYIDKDNPLIPSWKLLFESPEYAGKITMLDSMYNAIGTALIYLGYSYNSDNEEELMQARDVLLKQKPSVMAYDEWPKRLVLEEESLITHTWIGEAWFFHQDLETIEGALPVEGTLMGVDVLVIPKGAKHPAAAHLFMDYIFRPEINALLIETIGYAPNHTEAAKYLPEEMKKWPGVIPSEEYLQKCEYISPKAYTGKGLELRMKIWEELKQ